jgi:Coenzyme F420-dependent N5,N10-methylene tetrahydromethanopterin reductase and related flavin-dependent oxidoreductases
VLSKGRMRLLSVGVGALPGEAMAGGVDFATRGRRADEAIDVLRLLWDGDENGVSFDGEFFTFTACAASPSRWVGCPSTSGAPAWPRPAARASAATATSPAAGSPRPNGPPSRPDAPDRPGRGPGPGGAEYTRWGPST